MSFFDNIQRNVFQVTQNIFGDTASWLPFDGSQEQTAKVLYKEPTEKHRMDQNDIDIEEYCMEYKAGDFSGLFESVARVNNEQVKITFADGSENTFWVKQCKKTFDGKTIKAYLQPV